jgi:NADPH:quinone reductase-like Zn-dependent oxidoreductase
MKAISQTVYGTADVLRFGEVDRPTAGPDDVLVEIRAAGVDAGVWHLMTGLPLLTRAMGSGLRRPRVPVRGREFAGVVVAVGGNVTHVGPGDQVYGTAEGTFAEYASARQNRVARMPSGVTFEQAAALPIWATTALQALRDIGRLRSGQRVVVVGAGEGVGSYMVQIAKALDAEVTGVCGPAKVAYVASIGAHHVIDYTRDDFTDGTRRFDLIIDTAGNRPLAALRRALTPRGSLVIVGGEKGGRWFGGLERNLRAMLLSPFVGQRLRMLLAGENREDLERVTELVETGAARPVVDRTFTLSEAADAIRYAQQGHAKGKVVVAI